MRLPISFSLRSLSPLLSRSGVCLPVLFCVLSVGLMPQDAAAKVASPFPKTKVTRETKPVDKNAPVMLEAREVGYDREKSLIIARGDVEVVQGEQILFADQISYNQSTGVVRADGNVRLLQPDGNVIFAEHSELKNEMKQGIVDNFRARMIDNSIFAARTAKRVDEDVMVMKKAVYSPCKLPVCQKAKEEGKAPTWQVRAEKIKVDDVEQNVTYKNAWMEMYGIPVLYTPYLRHPTPKADATAGFLAPSYSNSSNLGFMLRTPYYMPISPSQELTLMPIFTTKEGPVMSGQYRQLFDRGIMQVTASGTYPEKRDDLGNVTDGREFRGHVAGYGVYQLDSIWKTGFELNRASDDTYMRRYKFGEELTLQSRLYAEGVKDRTHAIVQGVTFQGLEATDDSGQAPYVLPYGTYETESSPGWGGSRWRAEVGTMALARTEGTDTRRLSTELGWRLPVVTPQGHVFEFDTNMRAEAYNISDQQYLNTSTNVLDEYSGTLARAIPQASLTWKFPMQRPVGNVRWVIEPLGGVAISPNGTNDERIPNEDSAVVEFTDINVFSFNRYTGLDQVETGPRAYYGLRNQFILPSGTSFYAMAGQSYQTSNDGRYPFTSDGDSDISDYIGMVGFNGSWLTGNYRFRMAEDDFTMKRQEANMLLMGDFSSLSVDYVNISADTYSVARNELIASAGVKLTNNWRINGFGRRDLNDDRMVDAGLGFQYANDCLQWWVTGRREFTRDRDIQPDATIMTQIFFKNIN